MEDSKKLITTEKVKHIAHLARIGLQAEEVEKFGGQLEAIFGYMAILEEVDTSNVEPTTQVTQGLKNMLRVDEVVKFEPQDGLVDASPLPKIGGQILVKSVIQE